jgi:hypothetical protein
LTHKIRDSEIESGTTHLGSVWARSGNLTDLPQSCN